jgi:hypothetical protein
MCVRARPLPSCRSRSCFAKLRASVPSMLEQRRTTRGRATRGMPWNGTRASTSSAARSRVERLTGPLQQAGSAGRHAARVWPGQPVPQWRPTLQRCNDVEILRRLRADRVTTAAITPNRHSMLFRQGRPGRGPVVLAEKKFAKTRLNGVPGPAGARARARGPDRSAWHSIAAQSSCRLTCACR